MGELQGGDGARHQGCTVCEVLMVQKEANGLLRGHLAPLPLLRCTVWLTLTHIDEQQRLCLRTNMEGTGGNVCLIVAILPQALCATWSLPCSRKRLLRRLSVASGLMALAVPSF